MEDQARLMKICVRTSLIAVVPPCRLRICCLSFRISSHILSIDLN